MKAVAALERLGGAASTRALLRLANRRQIRRALNQGTITRLARGRYALPTAVLARAAAAEVSGVVCLRSAAAHHGWEMKTQPDLPEVAINPRHHLAEERRAGLRILWMNVADDDVQAGVTAPLKTVLDCARHLAFDEALAIADSALRSGKVTRAELDATSVRGAGAAAVRRVLAHADQKAANAFESALRAICIEEGLDVIPQHPVDLTTGTVHPDLVVLRRRLAIEADSWSFHATRRAHKRDCARYNLLVIHGWRVLRFTWEQVMHEPAYVRWVLRHVAAERVGQDEVDSAARIPA